MGNQSIQWFALYYLDRIDRTIKEKYKIKYYTRYMDDLILLHEDKEHLKACLAEIRAFAAEKLKLEFNEKTQIRRRPRRADSNDYEYRQSERNRQSAYQRDLYHYGGNGI